jgi:hypothetical protein
METRGGHRCLVRVTHACRELDTSVSLAAPGEPDEAPRV